MEMADAEVMRVVDYIKQTGEAQNDESILDGADQSNSPGLETRQTWESGGFAFPVARPGKMSH